jgi:transposase-like protein
LTRARQRGLPPSSCLTAATPPFELSEVILALYASGASTRGISRFLESVYGAFYSPQGISRLTQVVEVLWA